MLWLGYLQSRESHITVHQVSGGNPGGGLRSIVTHFHTSSLFKSNPLLSISTKLHLIILVVFSVVSLCCCLSAQERGEKGKKGDRLHVSKWSFLPFSHIKVKKSFLNFNLHICSRRNTMAVTHGTLNNSAFFSFSVIPLCQRVSLLMKIVSGSWLGS